MKLFLNSFHIDYYQANGKSILSVLYMTPLAPGARVHLSQPPLTTKHPGAPHSLLCNSPGLLSFHKTTQNFQFGLAFPCVLGTQPFSTTGMCSEVTNGFPLPVFSQTCHLAGMQVIHMCGDSPSFSTAFNRSDIYYPKISISGTYDLREIFKRLGVTDGFITHADLSGIAGKLIL